MVHERVSLNLVLLLLIVNFESRIWLELLCISPVVNITSRLTHLMILSCLCNCHSFYHLHQQNKSPASKVKFRQASDQCKKVFEAAKLAYVIKTKESITSQKLSSWNLANSVLKKGKSAIPNLFNSPEVLPSASDKAKLFPKNFCRNSNLDDSGIFYLFSLLELI